eukprot:g64204.t1
MLKVREGAAERGREQKFCEGFVTTTLPAGAIFYPALSLDFFDWFEEQSWNILRVCRLRTENPKSVRTEIQGQDNASLIPVEP